MRKKIFLALTMLISSSAFASTLTMNSSWESILASDDVYLKNHEISVGKYQTDVFSVEHDDSKLYTKSDVDNGKYRLIQKGGERSLVWVENKEKAVGDITTAKPVYERSRINGDNENEMVFKGYEKHTEVITRDIAIYDKKTKDLLFEKSYTIEKTM